MSERVPKIGDVVLYRVTQQDADAIMRRRTSRASIAERIQAQQPTGVLQPGIQWPLGAQAHIGNDVFPGNSFPMIIVRTWGTAPGAPVNGQVFLDGNDVLWALSVSVGDRDGAFSYRG